VEGGINRVGETGQKTDREDEQLPRAGGGGNTQSLAVYVDDADADCERARAAGAEITMEPATQDYGEGYWVDRSYGTLDLEGHHWWFLQRLR